MPIITAINSSDVDPFEFKFEACCIKPPEGSIRWEEPMPSPEFTVIFNLITEESDLFIFKDNNSKDPVRILINGKELLCYSMVPRRTTELIITKDNMQHIFSLSFEKHQKVRARSLHCGYCAGTLETGCDAILHDGLEFHEECFYEFNEL